MAPNPQSLHPPLPQNPLNPPHTLKQVGGGSATFGNSRRIWFIVLKQTANYGHRYFNATMAQCVCCTCPYKLLRRTESMEMESEWVCYVWRVNNEVLKCFCIVRPIFFNDGYYFVFLSIFMIIVLFYTQIQMKYTKHRTACHQINKQNTEHTDNTHHTRAKTCYL